MIAVFVPGAAIYLGRGVVLCPHCTYFWRPIGKPINVYNDPVFRIRFNYCIFWFCCLDSSAPRESSQIAAARQKVLRVRNFDDPGLTRDMVGTIRHLRNVPRKCGWGERPICIKTNKKRKIVNPQSDIRNPESSIRNPNPQSASRNPPICVTPGK